MAYTQIDVGGRFQLFMELYLGHYLTHSIPEFHRDWYRGIDDDAIEFLAIEAGRGSAKSTIASIGAPLYFICERDWDEIQTFSESGGTTGMSTKWMRRITKEVEANPLLIHDFGLRRGEVWTQDHIQVVRADGHRVDLYCRGKHSAARGSRGIVIIDDPQSEDDCKSETVLQRDEDWALSDVLPILLPGQRLIFIGTPISPLSLLSKFKQLDDVTVMSFPAEDPPWSGKSRWPEQWPDEYLATRKRMMGIDRYGAEYLCEPKVSGNPVWKAEWFKNYDPHSTMFQNTRQDGLFVVTAGDCAESKSDQADYTAWVTLGAVPRSNGDIFLLDARRGHWTTKQGAEQPLLIYDTWQQAQTIAESRVSDQYGGDAMIQEIRALEQMYGKYVNLYPVKPVKDKVTRAMQVQAMAQSGRVHVNRLDKSHQDLLSELTMFTGKQNYHDDLHDAFVMALAAIKSRTETGTGGEIRSALDGAWV